MTEINKKRGKIIKVNSGHSFTVDIDTSKFSKYISKGIA
jgi:hypothetical protein